MNCTHTRLDTQKMPSGKTVNEAMRKAQRLTTSLRFSNVVDPKNPQRILHWRHWKEADTDYIPDVYDLDCAIGTEVNVDKLPEADKTAIEAAPTLHEGLSIGACRVVFTDKYVAVLQRYNTWDYELRHRAYRDRIIRAYTLVKPAAA